MMYFPSLAPTLLPTQRYYQNLRDYTRLEKKVICENIDKGSIKITGPNHFALIDFGDGICDRDATISIDGSVSNYRYFIEIRAIRTCNHIKSLCKRPVNHITGFFILYMPHRYTASLFIFAA